MVTKGSFRSPQKFVYHNCFPLLKLNQLDDEQWEFYHTLEGYGEKNNYCLPCLLDYTVSQVLTYLFYCNFISALEYIKKEVERALLASLLN